MTDAVADGKLGTRGLSSLMSVSRARPHRVGLAGQLRWASSYLTGPCSFQRLMSLKSEAANRWHLTFEVAHGNNELARA